MRLQTARNTSMDAGLDIVGTALECRTTCEGLVPVIRTQGAIVAFRTSTRHSFAGEWAINGSEFMLLYD